MHSVTVRLTERLSAIRRNLPDQSTEDEILRVLRAESAAFFRGDFDEFARHWVHGPEVQRINSGPHIRTRISRGWEEMSARIKEALRRFPQDFDFNDWLRWENIQIQVGTDMAWVAYDQVAIRENRNLAASEFQHETKILSRVDGQWKLVFVSIVVPGIRINDRPRIELGKDAKIYHVNALARERLPDHPGLLVSRDRLRAHKREFDRGLQEKIKRAIDLLDTTLALDPVVLPAELVPLGEDDFGKLLYCWVTLEQQRVLVTFDDAHMTSARLELSANIFALSPGQQSLARLLAAGNNLVSAAEELGVSVNTVRTQLRRMFEKTGTHNQTALISTLLSVQIPA